MQRPNEKKRRLILAAATRLFSAKPFHEVRLEDVAAAAKIGKGTIYIYFRCKEELYVAIGREDFSALVTKLQDTASGDDMTPVEALANIVREFVLFAMRNPLMFQFTKAQKARPAGPKTVDHRVQLGKLIADTIRRGNKTGDFDDPNPEITAEFIPGAVRASLLYGPPKMSAEMLSEQILRIIGGGLRARRKRVRI